MTPKNGTMILSISHMSDLVEKELETGEVIIKQDISGTKGYVPSTGPASIANKNCNLSTGENRGAVFFRNPTLPGRDHAAAVTTTTASGFYRIYDLPTFAPCDSVVAPGFMNLMSERGLEMNRKVSNNKP